MSQDELQNLKIDQLEDSVEKQGDRLTTVEAKVEAYGGRFDQQDKALERIESGTANFGTIMQEQMASMRDAEREDKAAERANNAAWWAQAWKVAGVLASAATMAAGGVGYSVYQAPSQAAAPVAVEAAP